MKHDSISVILSALNHRFVNTPPDKLLPSLALCLTGFPIVIIIPIPFLLTKNKITTLRSI